MKLFEKCIEEISDSKIKCRENKSKIIFNNSSRISVKKIKVNGCQITEGVRCDYLIYYNKNKILSEHFIELKGADIKHAFEQLKRTIELLGNDNCQDRNSYVISSYFPPLSAEVQNQKVKFKKNLKSTLKIKNKFHEVEI